MSEFDEHIIDWIRTTPRDLIISIYIDDNTDIQIQAEMLNIQNKFPKYTGKIAFVNSASVFTK